MNKLSFRSKVIFLLLLSIVHSKALPAILDDQTICDPKPLNPLSVSDLKEKEKIIAEKTKEPIIKKIPFYKTTTCKVATAGAIIIGSTVLLATGGGFVFGGIAACKAGFAALTGTAAATASGGTAVAASTVIATSATSAATVCGSIGAGVGVHVAYNEYGAEEHSDYAKLSGIVGATTVVAGTGGAIYHCAAPAGAAVSTEVVVTGIAIGLLGSEAHVAYQAHQASQEKKNK